MEERFINTNARQEGRWLEVQRLMDKYTTAWRCSACGKQFDLKMTSPGPPKRAPRRHQIYSIDSSGLSGKMSPCSFSDLGNPETFWQDSLNLGPAGPATR